jgi:transposase
MSNRRSFPSCGHAISSSWTTCPRIRFNSVRQAIEAAGASLRYLPPYSPDFNPIEMGFAKRKALFRAAAARPPRSAHCSHGRGESGGRRVSRIASAVRFLSCRATRRRARENDARRAPASPHASSQSAQRSKNRESSFLRGHTQLQIKFSRGLQDFCMNLC